MIICKSGRELEMMKESGRMTAEVLELLGKSIRPGITGRQLDRIAEEYLQKHGAKASFKGYNGYPAALCVSPNHYVVHGIPNDIPLREGDIVSLDFGVLYKGFNTDAARTFPVGSISDENQKLIDRTRESFYKGIEFCKVGYRISDISSAIQQYAESYGYSLVRALTGHGVGEKLHEDPEIPNFGRPGRGPRIQNGMTLAIEPMVNLGSYAVEVLPDGWGVVTKDRMPSAHYENTVAVIDGEPVLLTEIL